MRGVFLNHGYVQARVQHKGKVHSKNFGPDTPFARKQAESYVKELKKNLRLGLVQSLSDSRLPFNKAAELVKNEGNKYFLPILVDEFQTKPLHEITPADILTWRKRRLASKTKHGLPIKQSSVNREQAVLSALFSEIKRRVKTGELPAYQLPAENPCTYVKKTGESLGKRTRVFTLQELQSIKDKCKELQFPYLWHHIKLAIVTTLRRKDLLREVQQANEQRTMEAEGQASNDATGIRGIQAKTGRLYSLPITVEQTSTSNGDRAVGKLTKGQLRGQWEAVREAAKIKDAQWRDFRRTGASYLEEAGYSTQLIKNVLGHASESMTEHYLDMDTKKIKPLVQHLDGLLSSL